MATTTGAPTGEHLVKFASGSSEERLAGLKGLMKAGLPSGDPHFEKGCALLVADAARVEGSGRLLAVVAAQKIINKLGEKGKKLQGELAEALRIELPSPDLLKDPADRVRVLEAIAPAPWEWRIAYATRTLVEQPPGATSMRAAAAAVLLGGGRDLGAAFDALAFALAGWEPQTKTPADTLATVVSDVLEGLRAAMVDEKLLLGRKVVYGDRPASALTAFLQAARTRVKEVPAGKAARGLVDAVSALFEHVVRSRFSLAVSSVTYAPIRILRDWLAPTTPIAWERLVASSDAAQALIPVAEEALIIAAQQRVSDDALFEVLVLLTGSRESARERARELARRNTGVPEEIRHWLQTGDLPAEGSASRRVPDAAALDVDRLAHLLQSAERVESKLTAVESTTVDELEMLSPRLVPSLRSHFGAVRQLGHDVRQLAATRGLALRGNVGEIVRFAPAAHRRVDEGRSAGVWVRIVAPAVEQTLPDGFVRVILQASVEATDPPAG